MSEAEIQTVRSFCRVCTCLCGILVEKEGDRVARVRGDRDHPHTRGYTCAKGRGLPRMHHNPKRLERPMMRSDGALRPASWDDCLDDLAARLSAVIDRHGPSAVGVFFGSGVGMDAAGYRMCEALYAAIGTPAKFSPMTIDGTAKVAISTMMGGFPGFSARPDADNVKLVIYVGINPVVSHGHNIATPIPTKMIDALRERGEVWVIDPRETETSFRATRHIAPRPGTDYAILAYLVRELLIDGANLDAPAGNAVGIDELRAAVEPFTRDHAAEIAGVAPADVSDLLASVRKAGRLAVETGTGVTMSAEANLTQWFAWAIMILTDSMNRPGGVWFHPGFFNRMDAVPLPVLSDPFGPGPAARPELRSIVGEWPCAALADEIEAGNIRALLNLGGAILTSFPDENGLRSALEKLDVFATIEIIANETTALSTHVLPTKDQLERPDMTLWDFLNPRVSAQYTPAVVDPVGERRSTWWVVSQLMRRLGYDVPDNLPADDRAPGADEAMLAPLAAHGRCSFSELTETGYVETELELPARWVDDHIERAGGWQLAPGPLVDQLAALHKPRPANGAGTLRLIPRRQARHVNAQMVYLGDSPDVLIHPGDAAPAGIKDGQPVVVRSDTGELVGTARFDKGMRPGVVSVPHGFEDANVNLLTDAKKVDPLTGMTLYSGFEVSVRPAARS